MQGWCHKLRLQVEDFLFAFPLFYLNVQWQLLDAITDQLRSRLVIAIRGSILVLFERRLLWFRLDVAFDNRLMVLGLFDRVSDARDRAVASGVESHQLVLAWWRFFYIALDAQLLQVFRWRIHVIVAKQVPLCLFGALDDHFEQLIRSSRLLERWNSLKLLAVHWTRYATESIDDIDSVALLSACLAHDAVVSRIKRLWLFNDIRWVKGLGHEEFIIQ